MFDDAPISIAAKLDLADEAQHWIFQVIRRMHTGRWPLFRRMHDIKRVRDELVELAAWRRGSYAVVRWNLKCLGLSWRDYPTLKAARQAFLQLA